MDRFHLDLPIDEVRVPDEGDDRGSVVFFLDDSGEKEKPNQSGPYFSMTWAHWLSLGKPTILHIDLEGE